MFHKGDDVEAIILSINHDEKKVSLGVKQLFDDPWPTIFSEFPPSKVVDCKVISTVDYGVFVRLDSNGAEGLVHISDLGKDYFKYDAARHELLGERTKQRYRLGDRLRVKIAKVDLTAARIDFVLA